MHQVLDSASQMGLSVEKLFSLVISVKVASKNINLLAFLNEKQNKFKKKIAKIKELQANMQASDTTAVEDIRQEATQLAGLDSISIPDDYYRSEEETAQLAGGGIVAFANGGVPYIDGSVGYPFGGLIGPAIAGGRAALGFLKRDPLIAGARGIGIGAKNLGKAAVTRAPLTTLGTLGGLGYGAFDYMTGEDSERDLSKDLKDTDTGVDLPAKKVEVSDKTVKKIAKAEDSYEKALREELDKTNMSEDDKLQALGYGIMKASSKLFKAKRGKEGEAVGEAIEAGVDQYVNSLEKSKKDRKELTKTLAEYGLAKEKNRIAESAANAQLAQSEAAMVRAERSGQAGMFKEVMDAYGKYLQTTPKDAMPFPVWAQSRGIPMTGFGGASTSPAAPVGGRAPYNPSEFRLK